MNVTDYARDAKVPNTSAMRNKWYNQKITHTKPGKVRHVECRNLQPLTNAEFLRIRRARIRHEQEKLEMDTEEASIKPKSVLDKDGLRKLSASIRNHEKAKAKKKAKK